MPRYTSTQYQDAAYARIVADNLARVGLWADAATQYSKAALGFAASGADGRATDALRMSGVALSRSSEA